MKPTTMEGVAISLAIEAGSGTHYRTRKPGRKQGGRGKNHLSPQMCEGRATCDSRSCVTIAGQTATCDSRTRCHSRRKLAASARISRSGCFLNRVFVLKSCSWLKVFSAANGLECIRGQSNPLSNFVLSAKLCPIFALSARLCCFSTAAIERECSCLSAKICRFWRPLIAVSDTLAHSSSNGLSGCSPCQDTGLGGHRPVPDP